MSVKVVEESPLIQKDNQPKNIGFYNGVSYMITTISSINLGLFHQKCPSSLSWKEGLIGFSFATMFLTAGNLYYLNIRLAHTQKINQKIIMQMHAQLCAALFIFSVVAFGTLSTCLLPSPSS